MSCECSCPSCVSACHKVPGYFLPSEIAPAAAHLGMSIKDFFEDKLVVDYYLADDEVKQTVFSLAPARDDCPTGIETPFNPYGRCVFLDDDERCSIHPVKPFECAASHHDETKEVVQERHRQIVDEWVKPENQQMIRNLLGREPSEPEPTGEDAFALMMNPLKNFFDWSF